MSIVLILHYLIGWHFYGWIKITEWEWPMSLELAIARQQNLLQRFQWHNPLWLVSSFAYLYWYSTTSLPTYSTPVLTFSKQLISCLSSWLSQFYSTAFSPFYQVIIIYKTLVNSQNIANTLGHIKVPNYSTIHILSHGKKINLCKIVNVKEWLCTHH